MVLAFREGARDQDTCRSFLRQLNQATAGESFQVSTDGLGAYTHNVPFELGSRVSFAQLIKNYASSQTETRYSPATIISAEKKARFGNPDMDRVCTSHVERLNLTLRMQSRRFTRLTNAHSKSLDHHKGMLAIFFAWYNFCRVHASLRGQTPAMASGLVGKPLTIVELLNAAAEI